MRLCRGYDTTRDLILDLENISNGAVKSIGPNVVTGAGFDQLRCHSQPTTGAAHTALHNVAYGQLSSDARHVGRLSFVGEGGGTCNDKQITDPRERCNDVFGQAISEVFLLRIA